LSAGYGGFSGLIGTLGVTFNNFSVANINDRSSWSPLPTGDGQKLSLRVQSNSRFFKSYNVSFTEPWLGGKKRNSFTIGGVRSAFDYSSLGSGALSITRGFVGLGSQLNWPDDFFVSNTTLNLEYIDLDNYRNGGFFIQENNKNVVISNGGFKNFSIKQTITRSSISDPLFPRSGSRVSLSLQLTPPYSLFKDETFFEVTDDQRNAIVEELIDVLGPGGTITDELIASEVASLRNATRFEWLEYHKWTFDSEWYYNLVGKLVFKAQAKFGYLGSYKKSIGLSPFERFELGGDGLSNQNAGITGRDIISLRGYETTDLPVNNVGGSAIYDKITMELRYPLSLNPNSTIFVTGFVQGGNAWSSFGDFNPFDLKRSAGVGMRVFLPMFGLLGFDYGFGFDKNLSSTASWTDYSTFNIILGFEPE
jgi:outer membrane protein insertion porin family